MLLISCSTGRVQVSQSECAGVSGTADQYLNRGHQAYESGHAAQAVAEFKKALCLAPKSVEVHLSLSLALGQVGRTDEGIAHADYILNELKPDSVGALSNKGLLLQSQGRLLEARDCHLKALSLRPDDPRVLMNLALVEHQMGNVDSAIEKYQRFLAMYPNNTVALSNLGMLYSGIGQFAKADAIFEKALRLDPNDYATQQNAANHYAKKKDFKKAAEHYRRACDLGYARACDDARWAKQQH